MRGCTARPQGILPPAQMDLMKPEALTFWHRMINLLTPAGQPAPSQHWTRRQLSAVSCELLPVSKALHKGCQGPSWSSPRYLPTKKLLDFHCKASVSLLACVLHCLSQASWGCTVSSAGLMGWAVQLGCAAFSASPSSWNRHPHTSCANSSRFCSAVGQCEA